jgi:Fe-S-cluster containining protein
LRTPCAGRGTAHRPQAGAACARCGACCRTFPIFASAADAEREPRIAAEALALAPWLRTERWAWRLHPLPFHETCCFLGAENRCAIYATRPAVCREFAPDGEQCRLARSRLALPPLPTGAPEGTVVS